MSGRVALQDTSQGKNDDGDIVKVHVLSHVSRTGKLKTYITRNIFSLSLLFWADYQEFHFVYSFLCMIKLYVNISLK